MRTFTPALLSIGLLVLPLLPQQKPAEDLPPAIKVDVDVVSVLTKMPSETERQPAEPRTPEGQPANVRLVPFATSAFQGGPGGVEERSGSKLTLDSVMVIVPAEPVFKSPTTAADATAPNDVTASHVRS